MIKDSITQSEFQEKLPSESRAFLDGVFSQCHGFIHIQIIHSTRKVRNPKTRKEEPETHSYFYKSVEEIPWDMLKEKNKEGFNIYFGICSRKEQKGEKSAVFEMPGIWSDIDGKHHGGKQGAWAYLWSMIGRSKLDPTVILDSGNGYHLYHLIKQPEVLKSKEDILKLEGYVKGVSQLLGGDHTHNINRIMRLPGFDNVKDLSNPKPCKIITCDFERRYSLADFDSYWMEITESQTNDSNFETIDIAGQIPIRFLGFSRKMQS